MKKMTTTFEVGKTYKMWGGGTVIITAIKNNLLIGESGIPYVRCWGLDGSFTAHPSKYMLLRKLVEPSEEVIQK